MTDALPAAQEAVDREKIAGPPPGFIGMWFGPIKTIYEACQIAQRAYAEIDRLRDAQKGEPDSRLAAPRPLGERERLSISGRRDAFTAGFYCGMSRAGEGINGKDALKAEAERRYPEEPCPEAT